jgi:hypothetical protein
VIAACTNEGTTFGMLEDMNGPVEKLCREICRKDSAGTAFSYWDLMESFEDGRRDVKEVLAADVLR